VSDTKWSRAYRPKLYRVLDRDFRKGYSGVEVLGIEGFLPEDRAPTTEDPLQLLLQHVQLSKRSALLEFYSGGHGEEETPVPIPNTAVKLLRGGSTWSAGSWEISTLPG
jgi:hypothetical protein